jgi:lysophospholipase L1-like esterase
MKDIWHYLLIEGGSFEWERTAMIGFERISGGRGVLWQSLACTALFSLLPAAGVCAGGEEGLAPAKLFSVRDGLGNLRAKLDAGQAVTIAYIGGSITQNQQYHGWPPGWADRTTAWFKEQWPAAQIKVVNAAIGGTESELAAYRLERDVLQYDPDILFIEYAVNDWRRNRKEAETIMEGIVRHVWTHNPATDVCLVYAFRENFPDDLNAGLCPSTTSAYEKVAEHYGIPSINVALRVSQLLKEGKMLLVAPTDKDGKEVAPPVGVGIYSNDRIHPMEGGIRVYREVVVEALAETFKVSRPQAHELKAPLVPGNPWQNARAVPLEKRLLSAGWENRITDPEYAKQYDYWRTVLPTVWSPPPWEADRAGEFIHLKFKGKRLNLYDVPGPDGVRLQTTIDGKDTATILRYDASEAFPYRMVLVAEFNDDLVHEVKVTILPPEPLPGKTGRLSGTSYRVKSLFVIGEIVE